VEILDETHQRVRVAQVRDVDRDPRWVGGEEVPDTGVLDIVGRGPDGPVHFVAPVEEQFGQVGAVLAGDAGDESA
jgi:hypothetical protein